MSMDIGQEQPALDRLEDLVANVKSGCWARDVAISNEAKRLLRPRSAVEKSAHPARRHRRSNDVFRGIRQNTARGRRIVDLMTAYLHQLGDPTSVTQQAAVLAAVQLMVLAEEARFAALAASPPTCDQLDQIVRLQAAAGRARSSGSASTKLRSASATSRRSTSTSPR